MPHCIVEFSNELDGKSLVPLVYHGAMASALFDRNGSDIKVRAIPYIHFQTGNIDIDCVHVTLKILSGRTAEQKAMLSRLVLQQLESQLTQNCSISVEVTEIDRGSYAKVVV